jgi:aromatic-L-amino-acid/L-tryptophan decarboxylase
MIHDTASLSTMHAIAAARVAAAPGVRDDGAPADLVVYTSEHAHSSIEKGALALGMGRNQVRKIATDAQFRLHVTRPSASRHHRRPRRRVCTPAVSSPPSAPPRSPAWIRSPTSSKSPIPKDFGTTSTPLTAAPPRSCPKCAGCSTAPNAPIPGRQPAQVAFTPIDLSAFLLPPPDVLRQAFSLVPSYLRTDQDDRAVNLMDYGVPLRAALPRPEAVVRDALVRPPKGSSGSFGPTSNGRGNWPPPSPPTTASKSVRRRRSHWSASG